MANRRMFSMTIIDTDAFLEMPDSSQVLYFHLAMRADDDGFISNPKRISRMIGASDDDLKLLVTKEFLIPFESGVCVIRHWRLHNYIRKDRYTPTFHKFEKSLIGLTENNSYTDNPAEIVDTLPDEKNKGDKGLTSGSQTVDQMVTKGRPMVDQRLPQDRIGKDRLGKVSIGKDSKDIAPPLLGEFKNVKLSDEEKTKIEEQNLNNYINVLSVYLEQTGKKYKSHYATILSWSRRDANEKQNKKNRTEIDVVYPTVTSTKISPEEEAQLKQAFEMLES